MVHHRRKTFRIFVQTLLNFFRADPDENFLPDLAQNFSNAIAIAIENLFWINRTLLKLFFADPADEMLTGWEMRSQTRKRSADYSKSADVLFSCLDSEESRHYATHFPVRKIAYMPLPSEALGRIDRRISEGRLKKLSGFDCGRATPQGWEGSQTRGTIREMGPE